MLEKEEIIEILSPLNSWGRAQEVGAPRADYLLELQKLSQSKDTAVAVIGVRRAGKTYLTKQFLAAKQPKNTLYVLLEEPKFEPYLKTDLLEEIYQTYRNYVHEAGECFLVLDEIQNVPRWEKWVRVLIEKKEKVKIIITGSSSNLLSSQLATTLTGRTLTLKMFPLSFKEFLGFKGYALGKKLEIMSQRRQWEKLLSEYLNYGGFPQVVLEKNTALKSQLLRELFEGIIYRDVIARHKIKEVALVKTIAELSLNNFSGLGSATKLRNIAAGLVGRKISPNFVLQILSYLEEAFLVFQVPIFSYKVKEQKLYPKKFYGIDAGLINAVTIKSTENTGRLYENLVALALFQKWGKENIFYWKSQRQEEVDFVVKAGLKIKQLIQVCYEFSSARTKDREISALLKAAQELDCANLLVITRDVQKAEKIASRRITYQPLWQWLLEH